MTRVDELEQTVRDATNRLTDDDPRDQGLEVRLARAVVVLAAGAERYREALKEIVRQGALYDMSRSGIGGLDPEETLNVMADAAYTALADEAAA